MGPLATHMAAHILLMNLVAPLVAGCILSVWRTTREAGRGGLLVATLLQLALLWVWHAPPLLDKALASPALHLLMYCSLFFGAFLFWWMVLGFRGERQWQPIVALLVTSKLYCLLAVLFVFAPRALYPDIAGAHPGHGMPVSDAVLVDQQRAGLIMLIACPVTYVVTGIAIGARWLLGMEADERIPRLKAGERAWT